MKSALPLALLWLLTACSGPPLTRLLTIDVQADADMNAINALQVDLVFAYDKESDGKLPDNARDWVARQDQLGADLAGGISVLPISLVPSSGTLVTLDAAQRKAIAVYSYANYLSQAGQARVRLTPYKYLTLRLGAERTAYTNQEKRP